MYWKKIGKALRIPLEFFLLVLISNSAGDYLGKQYPVSGGFWHLLFFLLVFIYIVYQIMSIEKK